MADGHRGDTDDDTKGRQTAGTNWTRRKEPTAGALGSEGGGAEKASPFSSSLLDIPARCGIA